MDEINQLTKFLMSEGPVVRSCSGLSGSALAYGVAQAFKSSRRTCVVFLPHTIHAEDFRRDLVFYLGKDESIRFFPPLGAMPYYGLSPNPVTVAERMAFLYALTHAREPLIALVPIASALRRLPPRSIFNDFSSYIVAHEEIEREELQKKLLECGYLHVPLVEDPGTFSRRGGIIDLFPPQLEKPMRLEFFGDQVESLRYFDPETQRSLEAAEDLVIIPAREVVFSDEHLQRASRRFREQANNRELGKQMREPVLDALRNRMAPPSLDTFLPFFYEQTANLFDYMSKGSQIWWIEPELCLEHCREIHERIVEAERACETAEKAVEPQEIFLSEQELESELEQRPRFIYRELAEHGESQIFHTQTHDALSTLLRHAHLSEEMLAPLINRIREWMREGIHVLLVAGTHSQALRLKDLLDRSKVYLNELQGGFSDFISRLAAGRGGIYLAEGHLSKGFLWSGEKLAILTDQEIFGEKQRSPRTRAKAVESFTSFEEIGEGDYIVHEEHGIGIYRGLQSLNLEGQLNDFLLLEYLGGDKLYLPVYRLNLVSRYFAQEGYVPRLDKLGGGTWEKSKTKVRTALRAMAGELLKLYAERATQQGYTFSPRGVLYEEFEATFPYEETPDQLRAIQEVNQDMDEGRPMDRLVCGDVGFGKTEVAMRAAFRAVLDNKQVAVLVPTTVLALQHERNFRERFKNFPAHIEMLSRFVNPKRQKEVLEGLKNGRIDIVIGTHGLLNSEVHFKDLGILIVDEEHRFGVAQKERIKHMKRLADVLTLTATPIPRTLNMALSGIRDLSVIATPPVDRFAIQTFVATFNDGLIREAILRELSRGGQVYFIHNRVQNIQSIKQYLEKLVPEAKVEVGHGQMKEKELEEVMVRFIHREFNVFLCTTIVESGLDIPSANTMIVNRADTFGLAQLYQLRGRIGRSNMRAYAYLLIPGQESITSQARARLAVLQRYTDLGSGFKIAAHDLEIRGSGNLLGPEQSGHITSVGYELYMRLLEEALMEVKGEEAEQAPDPELQLKLPAAIPEDYIPETTMRLSLYKRFASVLDEVELDQLAEEVHDRFGTLPDGVKNLVTVMRVKIWAKRAWIKSIRLEARRAVFSFAQNSPVDLKSLTKVIEREPQRFQWISPHELAMGFKIGKESAAIDGILQFLTQLTVK